MDPVSILTAISTTLGIVDTFTDIIKKSRGEDISEHSVQTQKDGEYLKILHNGHVSENIHMSKFNISAWDDKRYKTLEKKIDTHWSIFNDIDSELPAASVDEKARLKQRLESVKKDLCKDFRELIKLHEGTLGVPLGDHYSLYDVCGVEV